MSVIPKVNRLRKALGAALGFQGDEYKGSVDPSMQAVILSEDMTDQRHNYLQGTLTWRVGTGTLGTDGAHFPTCAFRPRSLLNTGPTKILRLLRIREISIFSTAVTPPMVGFQVFAQGFVPVFFGATIQVDPTQCDGRMSAPGGATQTSLYQLVTGLSSVGPFPTGTDNWSIKRAPGAQAGTYSFDPRITLRYGDQLWIAADAENNPFGMDIAWDEFPAIPQEFTGDAPWPGSI